MGAGLDQWPPEVLYKELSRVVLITVEEISSDPVEQEKGLRTLLGWVEVALAAIREEL